jgi:dTDP-3,4-didehydro-2,6-dideoxy-alpha-D-glucose 3-reductase
VRPLRVGVWGLGAHAEKRVLPAIDATPAVTLAGICTRDLARLQALGERHRCPTFSSVDELLAAETVDLVYVATPTGLHVEHARRALTAGKHVLCEKPLAARGEDAEALVALARARGLALVEALMYLHHPHHTALRERVGGQVHILRASFSLPPLAAPGFREDAALGGGALLDVGCYPLSLALDLIDGEPTVTSARLRHAGGIDRDGHATLEFPGGEVAFVDWAYDRTYVNEATITFTRGVVRSNRVFSKGAGEVPTLSVCDERGTWSTETAPAADAFVQLLTAVAEGVSDATVRDPECAALVRRARLLEAIVRH